MITIQSGMLIALGFLAAMLIGLLAAPAFWSRAVRLTTRRLKETMPLTEMEIVADRDRIRAEYAIKMHKLETLVEQVKLAGARQHIEINRRDARVNMLEGDLERLKAGYEEAQNARRVLEQTITDRLPRVEGRLIDAKKHIFAREREVGELTRTAERQVRALAEASSINAQQQSEIERLSGALSRTGRVGGDGVGTLKAELDALRAKTREQAQLLARMQSMAGRPSVPSALPVAQVSGSPSVAVGAPEAGADDAAMADLKQQLRQFRARTEDQAGEIARLKAAVAVFENEASGDAKRSLRDSRIALKARAQSLEAQSEQQTETIGKLRAELAAANERLARQAVHYTGELRRLGTGAPATTERGRQASERASLAARVAQARGDGSAPAVDAAESSTTANGAAEHANGHRPDAPLRLPVEVASAVEPTDATVPAAREGGDRVGANAESRPRLLDRIAGLSRTS